MFRKVSILVVLCFILSLGAFAYLSPAMESMANGLTITRWVRSGTALEFDDDDLENLFGDNILNAELISLPNENEGILTLFGSAVKVGQVLSEEEFDELTFTPTSGFGGTSEFSIKSGNAIGTIRIRVTDRANFAPETASASTDTQRGIAVFSSFSAADPDGDKLSYEIVSYPRHGSVDITVDGQFIYLPKGDFMGNDSFSYRAVDVFGNFSKEATIKVKVSRPAADIYFDDMKKHWAHGSAVKMAATGLMGGEKNSEGKLCFNPEGDMTRGDFLALSLIMAGYEEKVPYVSKTIFADDAAIAHNIKSYAQFAYDKGIISGYDNGDGTINFESAGAITRAEAAIIASRILGLDGKEAQSPSYSDAAGIPVWASGAVVNLSSAGIINGDSVGAFSAERILTRAEGAQIICNIAEYMEERDGGKEKNLFNLFGLLD